MRKNLSQITIAIVCAFLGFMLTYEFRLFYSGKKDLSSNKPYTNGAEISVEAEALSNQGNELKSKQIELYSQLKKYEENATNQEELNKQISNQISDTKSILGLRDVQGSGIIVSIILEGSNLIGNDSNMYIKDEEINYIVNELKFAGAEAIAVNNKRITSQTSVKSIEKNNYILVNEEKISPKAKIEIKAIGDKVKLYSALSFAGTLEYGALHFYRIDINPVDSIIIPKYNGVYKTEHLKGKQ
jgi:uncharacterized protein YlxW (UPF0749 family)